jgi:hypothetical protein
VLEFLQTVPKLLDPGNILDEFKAKLNKLNKPIIQKSDLQKLVEAEATEAAKLELPEFKFATNDEMLAAMGLN